MSEQRSTSPEVSENEVSMEETAKKRFWKPGYTLWTQIIAALILAALLLLGTKLAVVDLLKGPTEVETIAELDNGTFVSRDIYAVIGLYAEQVKADKVTTQYALVPMGGQFVTVAFTNRYLEAAKTMCDNTYDYINGKLDYFDAYVELQGTVGVLDEEVWNQMYAWFELNEPQLVEMGMIAEAEDYSSLLSDKVLVVDTVKGIDQTLLIVCSAAGAACLIWALVVLIIMLAGRRPKSVLDEAADIQTAAEQPDGEDKAEEGEEEGNDVKEGNEDSGE